MGVGGISIVYFDFSYLLFIYICIYKFKRFDIEKNKNKIVWNGMKYKVIIYEIV